MAGISVLGGVLTSGFIMFAQDVANGVDPLRHAFEASVLAGAFGMFLWWFQKREIRIMDEQKAERDRIHIDAKEREDRLYKRVAELSNTINNKLFEHNDRCATMMSKIEEVLERFASDRPCLIAGKEDRIIKALENIKEKE